MSKWLNNMVAIADGMSGSVSSSIKNTVKEAADNSNNNSSSNAVSNSVTNNNNVKSEALLNSTFAQIDSGLDNIKTKLSIVANILSEDLSVDNVGFKVQEINELNF